MQVFLCDKQNDSCKSSILCSSSANKENENEHMCFLITVVSNSKKWVVRRSYRNFMFLDTQLHRCVYDRKYSLLQELPHLPQEEPKDEDFEVNLLIFNYEANCQTRFSVRMHSKLKKCVIFILFFKDKTEFLYILYNIYYTL